MGRVIKAYLRDDGGATAVEYGLIAAFIMVALVSTLMVVGSEIRGPFADVDAGLKKRVL